MRCYTLLLGLVGCLAHSLLSGYAWLATAYTMSMNATRRVDHEFDSFVDWTPILETLLRLVLEFMVSPTRDLRVSVGQCAFYMF